MGKHTIREQSLGRSLKSFLSFRRHFRERRLAMKSERSTFSVQETATDLACRCSALAKKGTSFATIWGRVLKTHRLVEAIPRERIAHGRTLLRIPMITGEWMVFDAVLREFRIE